jgi:chromosome segregation ATPase
MDNQDVENFKGKAAELAGNYLADRVYQAFGAKLDELISEPIARAQKLRGEAEQAIAAAKTQLGAIEQNIVGKKAEATKVAAELQELQAEKQRREASVSLLLEEEKRLQARLESLRHALASEARA